MNDLFLHIGIQRTGTTFLQEVIFPMLENVNPICKREKEVMSILESPDLRIDDKKKILKYFKDGKINLISDENIWWHHTLDWFRDDVENRRVEHLRIIHEMFPDAKILFGTRNVEELIVSLYNYYVVYGGYLSFKKWHKDNPQYSKDNINYDSYIEHLQNLYGKDRVYIYEYEDMTKDINDHVKGICDFIGVEPPKFKNKKRNSGHSLWQLKTAVKINRFFRSEYNPNGLFPGKMNFLGAIFRSDKFPKKLRGRSPKLSDFIKR